MKKSTILLPLFLFCIEACQAQEKQQNIEILNKEPLKTESKPAFKGFDFTPYLVNLDSDGDTDSTNSVNFNLNYHPDSVNIYGEARGFMIHKKGIKYWFDFAQKEYKKIGKYDNLNYGYLNAAKMLKRRDRHLLHEFDKWMFFEDKQYLNAHPATGERDANDPNLGKPRPDEYYLKANIEFEKLLLEQKSGEKVWHIIGRRKYRTGEYGGSEAQWQDAEGVWQDKDTDHWADDFYRAKVRQYAKMK